MKKVNKFKYLGHEIITSRRRDQYSPSGFVYHVDIFAEGEENRDIADYGGLYTRDEAEQIALAFVDGMKFKQQSLGEHKGE